MVIVVASGLIGGCAGLRAKAVVSDITIPEAVTYTGAGVASSVLDAWLNGEPSPIPAPAEYVAANFVHPPDAIYLDNSIASDDGTVEAHEFRCRIDGVWRNVGVVIRKSGANWVLVGVPTLAPVIAVDGNSGSSTFGGEQPDEPLSDGAVEQVDAWAAAYATGDSVALKRLTGDTTASNFVPLGGFDAASVDIVDFQRLAADMLQVRVLVTMVGTSGEATGMWDVFLGRTTDPLPVVLDWQAVGNGREIGAGAERTDGTVPAVTTTTMVPSDATADGNNQ